MPEKRVEEVLGEGNYVQIEEGLTDAMAHTEARRCLRCDVCIGCGCAWSPVARWALRRCVWPIPRPAGWPTSTLPGRRRCASAAGLHAGLPTGAIHFDDRDGVRRTVITGTVVKEQPLLTCSECGAPTQTPAHREFIRNRLPAHMAALLIVSFARHARASGPIVP